MFKRLGAVILGLALAVFGMQAPASAVAYDYSVDATAVASSGVVPSVISWTVTVSSAGDPMGANQIQSGTVKFTAPSSISVIVSDDCDTTGLEAICQFFVRDGVPDVFEVYGFVSLTALGAITITPTITATAPRADSVAANNSATVTCNAITSLLVLC